MRKSLLTVAGWLLLAVIVAAAPPERESKVMPPAAAIQDVGSYLDPGNILMFVTNLGMFGRDLGAVFDYNYGTFYPYAGIENISGGTLVKSPLWAAGLWLGGTVSGSGATRIAIAEYSSEYIPGPMAGGSHQGDRPDFEVYKLHRDSLADNPNDDYLNIPLGQGAPVDSMGQLLMLGDQMLWSVYNDADPNQHWNDAGSTAPMGIEVRQTIWGIGTPETGATYLPNQYEATPLHSGTVAATAYVVDPNQVTGDEYLIEIHEDTLLGTVWSLKDLTRNVVLLSDQTDFSDSDSGPVVDGLQFRVTQTMTAFENFECVANGAGPLDPPEGAAAQFAGFPSTSPTDRQQVGDGEWMIHTADNGGTSGGGTRGSFSAFVDRVTRSGALNDRLRDREFEIRFTGSIENPHVGGSYAFSTYSGADASIWVPFEIWDIGSGTPDDPSDDYQMVPWLLDADNDGTFNLASWGTAAYGGGDLEHSVSGGDNDPFTDWIYFEDPADKTPGSSGYLAAETDMLNGVYTGDRETEVLVRIVLVSWNGGDAAPFTQAMPEQGTIFRITTHSGFAVPDSLTFTATHPQAITTRAGGEGNAAYIRYDLVNKGGATYDNMYVSVWSDPDLGGSSDDLVGCDTIDNLWFCYNATNMDLQYGHAVPAVGFRVLQGPVVPSPGDTAIYFGQKLPGYRNLPMTAFAKYINGTDPSSSAETYYYMQGLTPDGQPYPNGTHFMCPGDPVSGTGELDTNAADRRMMASFGPFTFAPGDSQQVIVKMAVGQGTDRLSSITDLKRLLLSVKMLDVSPSRLSFSYTIGSEAPLPQVFSVTSPDPHGVSFFANESTSWLSLADSVGYTPGTVGVTVNPAGLQAGLYTAYITVNSGHIYNATEYVTVTLRVLEPGNIIHPTDQWINLYCAHATIDGVPMGLGGIIDVLDPGGVLCGRIQTDIEGGYGFIPVYRDDSTSYDLDEGAVPGDTLRFRSGGEFLYPIPPVIWTANGDRVGVCQFTRARETCRPLHVGWNLISWNIDTPSDDVGSVASGVMDNLNVILSFEDGALTYDPALPKFSTLKALDHLHGYWFLMNGPDTLCLTGNAVPDNTGIPLESGWNVAPYYPGYPMSVENAGATILDRLQIAYDFDNGIRIWQPGSAFNTLHEMHRYQGYWLKLSAAGIWYQVRSDCTMIVSPVTTPANKSLGDNLTPTPRWVNLYAEALTLDGTTVPAATAVVARSEAGELVGSGIVQSDGAFGFMPVYGRENDNSVGLAPGEPFTLEVGGTATNEPIIWSQNGDRIAIPALTGKQNNLPHSFWLAQNYPNPFNPATTIRFSLAQAGPYCLAIYNLAGQKVAQFEADGEPGEQTIRWNASGLASGMYLYRLTADGATASRKMLLLK